MPPASLSTLAVMNPGPMTANSSTIRDFQLLSEKVIGIGAGSALMPQHRDHVVGGDDAGQAFMFVDHGERNEVVLVEERRDFVVGSVRRAADRWLAQIEKRRRR